MHSTVYRDKNTAQNRNKVKFARRYLSLVLLPGNTQKNPTLSTCRSNSSSRQRMVLICNIMSIPSIYSVDHVNVLRLSTRQSAAGQRCSVAACNIDYSKETCMLRLTFANIHQLLSAAMSYYKLD